jgi:hypothetical protein
MNIKGQAKKPAGKKREVLTIEGISYIVDERKPVLNSKLCSHLYLTREGQRYHTIESGFMHKYSSVQKLQPKN